MPSTDNSIFKGIIQKTLMTTLLMDGFWERWLAHGLDRNDLQSIRSTFKSDEKWTDGWTTLAQKRSEKAINLQNEFLITEAEWNFRISSLYYNLAQWIHPSYHVEKEKWYRLCQDAARKADQLSTIQIKYAQFRIDNHIVDGRIRVPSDPKGCIIMILPLDSNKEEFFTYECEFARAGFVTICFDGPGQGGTYIYSGLKSSVAHWANFVRFSIDYTAAEFQGLPIHLFGTSSGASWAIFGSNHENVSKIVAVSPAINTNIESLPHYFKDRMFSISEDNQAPLPVYGAFEKKPILIFHGKKDVMISGQDMILLGSSLPEAKLIEYDEEGHCCNNKLKEIRQRSLECFGGSSL